MPTSVGGNTLDAPPRLCSGHSKTLDRFFPARPSTMEFHFADENPHGPAWPLPGPQAPAYIALVSTSIMTPSIFRPHATSLAPSTRGTLTPYFVGPRRSAKTVGERDPRRPSCRCRLKMTKKGGPLGRVPNNLLWVIEDGAQNVRDALVSMYIWEPRVGPGLVLSCPWCGL